MTWRLGRPCPHVASSIKASRPDVVVVVELGNSTHRRLLEASLAPDYSIAAGMNDRFIFIRNPTTRVKDGGSFTVRSSEPGARSRPAAWATVSVGDASPLTVVGVHLTSTDSLQADLMRADEMRDIQAVAHGIARHTPIVFAGDFNSYSQSDSPRYEADSYRTRVHLMLSEAGWADAVDISRSTTNALLNSYNPQPEDKRIFGRGRHLDHIYVPEGVNVLGWKLLDRKGTSYVEQWSDHDPILADLELPDRSTR